MAHLSDLGLRRRRRRPAGGAGTGGLAEAGRCLTYALRGRPRQVGPGEQIAVGPVGF
ncbi:hypothetical protein [Streptomyces anandii]|uniref:hypothetical protein n=1 Tax=Streptomyces anandii TaxID=285454 RepID=UPI0036796B63